ncbi:MAG: ATP-binding protein [Pseudomonadota bacterium]
MPTDYEKLGSFYLGREFDATSGALKDDLVLYDSQDLTTHAVCVGMTGSGKTGLCLSLLEEAAIDGVPAICIDPKGDLGNLMLTFPNLAAADFEPWVDAGDAARKGQSVADYAAATAASWKKGLAEWDQAPERIGKLRAAAQVSIYTPGAETGLPLSVLRSFAPPAAELLADAGALRDRVGSVVSGLLSLLGIEADPIGSREHILLSNVLESAWRAGLSLDMTGLIQAVQKPPFDKLGAFDLETFFPAKDRLKLAMGINSLIASPGFATWMRGEPLDAQRLLFTPEGKPRISVISIAHLNDAERMFIVTLVLNEMITWMRTQSGTSSLRAIFYMDEIFGFFPPTANPSSKQPMLTLLKQARAFGLGVVLATQNPVDLDYKGLANCGTWFIGRLQTERDKLRVIEGLKSALAGAEDGTDLEVLMSSLTQRVFLMRNVHEDAPVLMKTRWALSYLRGPLTGPEISRIMAPRKAAAPAPAAQANYTDVAPDAAMANSRPALGTGITEYFLKPTQGAGAVSYKPMVAGFAKLHFVDPKLGLDEWQTTGWLAPFDDGGGNASWEDAAQSADLKSRLGTAPEAAAQFGELSGAALRTASYATWGKTLQSHLYETARANLFVCDAFKAASKAGESEGDFRARLTLVAREKRDAAVAELRKRWQAKLLQLQDQIRRGEERREREKSQLSQQRMQTAVSIGSSILGALLGRKAISATNIGRIGTAARSATRMGHESQDVTRAEESLDVLQQRLEDTKREVDAEVARLESTLDAGTAVLRSVEVPARKADIAVGEVALVWVPWRKGADGFPAPAYD